ncbi:unnamed protein product [Mytilus coruscus]|uniref:Uncharacterized protein n=1 Tax=Mytilus coruscus TaxID=42192 RepID=A0A6J8EDK3_MYTCO|nr:unnamed protein product [Mytilus coruscus]
MKTTYSKIHDVNDSKWVLMIPSVRAGSRAVDFFEKAWSKAFRRDRSMREKFITVTFPDAALTYYLYLPPERCNKIDINRIRIGERDMVIGFEEHHIRHWTKQKLHQSKPNTVLQDIFRWCDDNKMAVNVSKTKAICIGSKQILKLSVTSNENINLAINRQQIKESICEKVLGIFVDASLS